MQTPPGTTDHSAALPPDELDATFRELAGRARRNLVAAGADEDSVSVATFVEIRFRAQIHVLTVPIGAEPVTAGQVNAMVERFVDIYEGRFGKGAAFLDGGVEITTFRVVATSPVPHVEVDAGSHGSSTAPPATRQVFSQGAWRDAAVYRIEQLREGLGIDGLAIVELRDTTVVIGPDQSAVVDGLGNIVIEKR
nr:hypothetical protein [Saccharomonospora sp. CUA-673]